MIEQKLGEIFSLLILDPLHAVLPIQAFEDTRSYRRRVNHSEAGGSPAHELRVDGERRHVEKQIGL
jgi:hypothetical protein